jgi:hypothetical protein
MADVTPGFTYTSTTPITATNLNLLGQPVVTIGTAEVTGANIAALQTVSGMIMAANYKFVGASTTVGFSGTISLGTDNTNGNTRLITCSSNTACTITPASGGTAGEWMYLIFSTDATGGNVITYASPFKSIGTHTLTGRPPSANARSHTTQEPGRRQ